MGKPPTAVCGTPSTRTWIPRPQGARCTLRFWTLAIACGAILLTVTDARADLQSFLREVWNPTPQTPPPAVAQVVVQEADALAMGSGTLIYAEGPWGWLLTNWHVVRDASGGIEVVFPDGFRSPGQVMKTDERWDLALVACWRPPASPMPVAHQVPSVGDELTIAGYGQGKFRLARGACAHYAAPDRESPMELIDVSVAARQGDSGGPIMNAQGELAGVLFGSGGGMTTGSHVGRVREFLLSASSTRNDINMSQAPPAVLDRQAGPAAEALAQVEPQPFYPEAHVVERTAAIAPSLPQDHPDLAPQPEPPVEPPRSDPRPPELADSQPATPMPTTLSVAAEVPSAGPGGPAPESAEQPVSLPIPLNDTSAFLVLVVSVGVLILVCPRYSS